MTENHILGRIQQTYDSLENWEAQNPILLRGEVARVKMKDNSTVRTKTGNGSNKFTELPWDDNNLYRSDTSIVNIRDGNISWGGINQEKTFNPIDAAMVSELGANRFAFMPTEAIEVEYSKDDGITWLDYGATDEQKISCFSSLGTTFISGKASNSNPATADDQLRITLTQSKANLYTQFNKFIFLISTNGSLGCKVAIQGLLGRDLTDDTAYQTIVENIPISGWSGYNVINNLPSNVILGPNDNQYGKLRFIFTNEGHSTLYPNNAGLIVHTIYGFGGVGWQTPSNMAKLGHLYSWNTWKDAIFPNNVKTGVAPTSNNDLTNKKYVDEKIASINSVSKDYIESNFATKNHTHDLATENSLFKVSIPLNDTQYFTHPEAGVYDTLTANSYSGLGSRLELTTTDAISTNTILATFTIDTNDEYKNSQTFNGMILYPTANDYANDSGIKYNYYTSPQTAPTTYYGTIYKIKFVGDNYINIIFSELETCTAINNGFISDTNATALDIHLNDKSNPHGITPEKIRATPLSHTFQYDNPHKVTAAQVGAATAEHTHDVAEINSVDFTNLKNTSTGNPNTTISARFSLSTDSPYQGWYKLSDAKLLILSKSLIPVTDDNYVDIEIAAINCNGYVTCNSEQTDFDTQQTINFKYSGKNASDFVLRLSANSNDNTIYIKFNICKDGFMSGEDKLALSNLQTQVGDISTALDSILTIQNNLLGGNS